MARALRFYAVLGFVLKSTAATMPGFSSLRAGTI